jgi:hypothetical protein
MYDVKITILPDALLTSSGWPVVHKEIRLFNTGKDTVPGFGREERMYIILVTVLWGEMKR